MGTAIESGLGVAKYNQSNPDSQIKIGDRIVTLNGEKATMKTVREYEGGNNENTTLGIKRPEPAAPVASAPQQMVMGSNKPVGVPADAEFIKETFAGSSTTMFAVGGCLCCGPLALLICMCPIDERSVWKSKDGRRWTKEGARVTS